MIENKRYKKQYIGETKRQATNNSSHANASAAVPTHFNLSKLTRASTNTQYLTQESKGGVSDTQRPNYPEPPYVLHPLVNPSSVKNYF